MMGQYLKQNQKKKNKTILQLDIADGGYPILPTPKPEIPEETLNYQRSLIRVFATYHYHLYLIFV